MTFHQFRNIHSLHVALFTSTWMLEISSFSAVDCGALSFPLNGSSHGGSTTFPNSVHFSCDPGFILHGSSKRTCMATGSWSGIATTCAGKWKLKKHLKQPWTGNPFTHTRSFTTHYALTLTLIYSLIRRARRNCCLLKRLELCLAKERSSELFRENFLVISKFYPLRYLSLVNRREELLFLLELLCIIATWPMYLRCWASQNTGAVWVLHFLAISSLLYLYLFTPPPPMGRSPPSFPYL